MDTNKLIKYIENSFLKELLTRESITDISYNGESIFYMDNTLGRMRSDINLTYDEAKDFIRQVSNLSEKNFSYQVPYLDVSVGRYRINAIHQSIAKKHNQDAINFSIRIGSKVLRIKENSGFLPSLLVELFNILISSKVSIVIGGITGTGKTEFQKYLISRMRENTRLILIDNVSELDFITINPLIDMNVWIADNERNVTNVQSLVRNALRSNPDWLLVAEARGEEMKDILNSALTGHPIITTLHSLDIESLPTRMTRMVMMGDKKSDYESILEDICYHFRFYVYLKREISKNGIVYRYIDEISFCNKKKMEPIFKEGSYYKLSETAKEQLLLNNISKDFEKAFIRGENI